jgi:hypothetical protein
VLHKCGDNLRRENVNVNEASRQPEGLQIRNFAAGYPITTASQDFAPIEKVQLIKLGRLK